MGDVDVGGRWAGRIIFIPKICRIIDTGHEGKGGKTEAHQHSAKFIGSASGAPTQPACQTVPQGQSHACLVTRGVLLAIRSYCFVSGLERLAGTMDHDAVGSNQ